MAEARNIGLFIFQSWIQLLTLSKLLPILACTNDDCFNNFRTRHTNKHNDQKTKIHQAWVNEMLDRYRVMK